MKKLKKGPFVSERKGEVASFLIMMVKKEKMRTALIHNPQGRGPVLHIQGGVRRGGGRLPAAGGRGGGKKVPLGENFAKGNGKEKVGSSHSGGKGGKKVFFFVRGRKGGEEKPRMNPGSNAPGGGGLTLREKKKRKINPPPGGGEGRFRLHRTQAFF